MSQIADLDDQAYFEKFLDAAARSLAQKGHPDLGAALLECELAQVEQLPDSVHDWGVVLDGGVIFRLLVPEEVYDTLSSEPSREILRSIFADFVGPWRGECQIVLQIRLDEVEQGWREAAYAALGNSERNQGNLVSQGSKVYHGLRYRSNTEIMLAQELDERGILFFPLPAASRHGVIREPDFVIVDEGRVGIIEIHGEPWHPATRTAQDHARNRFFELSGIHVQVYDANHVRENTKGVVDEFLKLLKSHGR
jgi:hypothetical protein